MNGQSVTTIAVIRHKLIMAVLQDTTIEVTKFIAYVERTIAYPMV